MAKDTDNLNDDYVSEYLLVRSSALPEVFNNVMKVKQVLQSGKVNSVNEAVKEVGVSRSAYYKYRDDVQAWENPLEKEHVTIVVSYETASSALSDVVLRLSQGGNNIINIAQSVARNNFNDLMISCVLADEDKDLLALKRSLARIAGVRRVEILND